MPICQTCGKEVSQVSNLGNCVNCASPNTKYIPLVKGKEAISQNNDANAEVERLRNELENEKTLKEDYETKLRIIAEQRFAEKKRELNAPDWIKSPEALTQWIEANKKEASGTVSLREEDIERERGHDFKGKEFDSHEEMIQWLRMESIKGNEQAKQDLDRLWQKIVSGLKERPTNFSYSDKDWLTKFREQQTLAWKKKKGVMNE